MQITQKVRTGFVPFFRNKFSDFSRTLQGLRLNFQGLLNSLWLPHSQDLNVNSPYCLPYTSYLLVESHRFPELSRTSGLFPGLSSPGKCHNKIPGLSRFSRTSTNPEEVCYGCKDQAADELKFNDNAAYTVESEAKFIHYLQSPGWLVAA